MKNQLIVTVRCLAFAAGLLTASPGLSQVVNIGVKAGFNGSWTHADDEKYRDAYNVSPVPGFNAGGVMSFKIKERFYLHTELLYATKGRKVTGDLGLRDRVTYRYLEVPVMYQIHFKGNIGSRQFKWYAGVGPNFSYWLGGRGVITHVEITEFAPDLYYYLRFGDRTTVSSEDVFIEAPRRLQLGINVGGGVWVEPAPNRKFMVDLRFEYGHSWIADRADYLVPAAYSGDLHARNLGLRLSVMYMLQHNTDKKVRNKGKSGVRKKGKMLQRR